MKKYKITLLLSAFILTTNFVVAQKVTITPTPSDTTVSHTKPVREPTIHIGNSLTGGRQTKDAILENPCMSVVGGEVEWSILSYRVTFVRQVNGNGVEDAPITVRGACFTNEVISKIKSYPAGTNVEFSDIKIQSSAGVKIVPTVLMVQLN